MTTFRYDILGLGCVTVDDLMYVDAYPPADSKVRLRRRERQCGGLTATALVAAARLGSRCAYAAQLGDDELSRFVFERLHREGIDLAHLVLRPDACPIHSTIVVDEIRHTRTIFYDVPGRVGADDEKPAPEVVRSARVVFVDHHGVPGEIRAARIARQAGIPVVADLERDDVERFAELLALVDHLILPLRFAQKLTGQSDPARMAEALWAADRRAAVVTCGTQGCWYVDEDRSAGPRHQAAFPVKTVDTTGCGDVFHGAYASALARGMNLPERIRFATAAAALKATRRGAQDGIPTRAEVEGLLESRL
ncbi:MAG: PfkB family carbohydrate kinase [Pirellulales bacterium]